jgi:RNA polymerase sigma factor (sigma-70 family)
VSLSRTLMVQEGPSSDLLALDVALTALDDLGPRKCHVVEMRFFGGLSVEETADALHVSTGTVLRDWRIAKAWLARELKGLPHQ